MNHPASNRVTIDSLDTLIERGDHILTRLQQSALAEEPEQQARLFTITQAADMIGRTPQAIRDLEKQGTVPAPELGDTGRRIGYTLAQINALREAFGLSPRKPADQGAFRLSFQNFKGGVCKSTLSCHCAQKFVMMGYRVLLIDTDSQASATATFGHLPDRDIEAGETLLPYFEGEQPDIRYAIRETHWDQLHLIPANLDLYSAEYYLAGLAGTESHWIRLLEEGIASVEDDYDIILIDPPPSLGMISLNVLAAVHGLIVPTPASMYDYQSTTTFLRMLQEVLQSLSSQVGDKSFDFLKLLITKYDRSKSSEEFLRAFMMDQYGIHILRSEFLRSAEIENASSRWQTVYDMTRATTSHQTYQRCLSTLDEVFAEVESLIVDAWEAEAPTDDEQPIVNLQSSELSTTAEYEEALELEA